MTDDMEDEGLPGIQPTWWLGTLTRLWLLVWKIVTEEAVTDEDRRDANRDRRLAEGDE
jgi:hypothetical protein